MNCDTLGTEIWDICLYDVQESIFNGIEMDCLRKLSKIKRTELDKRLKKLRRKIKCVWFSQIYGMANKNWPKNVSMWTCCK